VVSGMHISYRLYLELPASMSVWPCETKIWLLENGFKAVLKHGYLYFMTHCMCSTACDGMCHPSVNQTFLSFLWVWNVTSDIEGVTCFEELWGKSYPENIWPIEGFNDRRTQKII
jgi:hypothetical protein